MDDERSQLERLLASVGRAGWRGARGVARRLGFDRAVDRALDPGADRPPASGVAERATERVLESETAKRVWGKVLESDEAQKLVERVAEAPEVRAAIAAQGVGLLEDLRRGVRRGARRLDAAAERVARGLLRRPARTEPPIYAGAVTRVLAIGIDTGVVYGSLLLVSAAIALLVSALSSGDEKAGGVVIAFGALAWILIASAYLVVFWSGAGRTPGMAFLGLRILSATGDAVSPRQAVRRVLWFPLSALPLMLGFAGILFDERRCGWPDRRTGTRVLYADPQLDRRG